MITRYKHSMFLSLAVLPLLLFISCASYQPFMAPGFTGTALTRGGLAVFPALVGEGSQSAPGVQGYTRTAGEEMASALKKYQPSLNVVTPTTVSATLANNDLVEDFSRLKENYLITGIVDVNIAKRIVEPLGVSYFMLPSIDALFSPSSGKAEAHLSAKIYDAQSAEMVFEAVQKGFDTSIFGGPPYEKAVKDACQDITYVLMRIYKQK